jgi:hypothetical protein
MARIRHLFCRIEFIVAVHRSLGNTTKGVVLVGSGLQQTRLDLAGAIINAALFFMTQYVASSCLTQFLVV